MGISFLSFGVWSLLALSVACAIIAALTLEKDINNDAPLQKNSDKKNTKIEQQETQITLLQKMKITLMGSKKFYFVISISFAFIFLIAWNVAFSKHALALG